MNKTEKKPETAKKTRKTKEKDPIASIFDRLHDTDEYREMVKTGIVNKPRRNGMRIG